MVSLIPMLYPESRRTVESDDVVVPLQHVVMVAGVAASASFLKEQLFLTGFVTLW